MCKYVSLRAKTNVIEPNLNIRLETGGTHDASERFVLNGVGPMRVWRDLHLVLRRLRLHLSSLLLDHHRLLLLLHRERHRLPRMRISRCGVHASSQKHV